MSDSASIPTDEISGSGPSVYVDEAVGSDSTGNGTVEAPYQSAAHALVVHGPSPPLTILTRKASTEEYAAIGLSALKKARKTAEGIEKKKKKADELREQEEREKEKQEKKLEESKKVVLVENPDLSKAVRSKIQGLTSLRTQRVRVFGWVHRLRQQKDLTFLVVRDGTGYLQVVLSGLLSQTYSALTLSTETSVEITGVLTEIPEGKTAPGGHEVIADWWQVIGSAPSGEESFSGRLNEESDPSLRADLRHLVLRGETASSILRLRSFLLSSFRYALTRHSLLEVTPPCMVQTQVEGGSTLFKFNYYGQDAYLTQSSQLYLETVLPSLGDVFCIQESFRAENSHTRRHLSEYTHLEAELAFINFDDLMTHIEDIICETLTHLLADSTAAALLKSLNPEFVMPERPFMRMSYADAIKWLNDHGIQRPSEDVPDGTAPENVPLVNHEIGDDIAEAAERKMTDIINKPIFLYGFPAELKAFYMKKMQGSDGQGPGNIRYTESCDLLMPNVGEIIGGSMRISDMAELLDGYKREGIDPAPYYWFTDQRKYGTCEHGGYGLGVERFLAWLANRYTVRECSLYPRWPGRATP